MDYTENSKLILDGPELLAKFSPEWVAGVDQYQKALGELSLGQLIEKPTPETQDQDQKNMVADASHNSELYDDAIEDSIYEDELMNKLAEIRDRYIRNDHYTQLIRTRRTVLAYMIFHDLQEKSKPGAA